MAGGGGRNRLSGFDAVRGLAAVAVVVLHAAYPYALAPLPGLVWPVPVDEPSRLADACFWGIEGFVMPLFFTISGYFLARSLERQGPGGVAAGRTRRLVVSFWTVGIVILAVDLMVWTLGFVASGQATWKNWRRMKFGPGIDDHLWGPGHLWYLEYLWVLCAGACLVVAAWRALVRQFGPVALFFPRWVRVLDEIEAPAFLPVLLGVGGVVFALLGAHPEVVLGFQHHLIMPAWPKLLHGGAFVLLGVALHRSPGAVEVLRRAAPVCLAGAIAGFAVLLPRIHEAMAAGRAEAFNAELGLLLAAYAVAAVLGTLGAGFRWLDRPNLSLERLAAASFWVYVAHHPICGLLQLGLRPVPIPAEAKFGVVTVATLGLCLFTYGRFVEGRAIGRMLDGEWPWVALRRAEPAVITLPAGAEVRKAA